jgi:acyl-CoA synthetase (AMP-forming)/AMP-acid ligase II
MFKLKTIAAACGIALTASAMPAMAQDAEPAAEAEEVHSVSANLGLVSDYRFRGISQTDRDPAIQGGFDYTYNPASIYVGTWLSNIDKDGFVYIVDRKKELIVTAGGKNIAPQPLENDLRLDKYISQAIVFGDRKPYLVALVTPDIERLLDFTKEEKIEYLDIDELVKNEKVKALFEARIATINKQLPPYKTIKHFALVARDFSIEGGELTPTLKLKRKEIYKKYADIVEELYTKNESVLVFHPKSTHGEEK